CLGKMEEVGREGRTVLFVSHNLGVLRSLCNQAVLLDKGQIIASGLADEVVARYHSSMVTSSAVYEAPQASRQQPVFIERAEIRDLRGNRVDEIPCGEGLRVVFAVQCVGNARIDRPWIGVRIINANGDLVSHIANREAGCELPPFAGQKTLTCELPQLNLLPGDYRIGFVLANVENHLYQTIESALSFSITPADTFKSGFLQTSRHGQIFLESRWCS
ncbi:MAG: Wzt carbohydrate-binding domain-containing protein, partial [Desulfuromonadales bacterium]|nr:Wzt carbohydrate-binding domain-containing protein [Desulfuromonadales bacterium]